MSVCLAPHPFNEAVGGRVDVEEAGPSGTGIAEAVANSRRSRDIGARPGADGLVADRELELPLEDVEGVDLVGVDVGRDRAELGAARELDHLELLALGLDVEVAVLPGNRLALAGA